MSLRIKRVAVERSSETGGTFNSRLVAKLVAEQFLSHDNWNFGTLQLASMISFMAPKVVEKKKNISRLALRNVSTFLHLWYQRMASSSAKKPESC